MHGTFVPDEVLTHTCPIQVDQANPHAESRSGSTALAASRTRYNLFRRRHEPGLYCAVPKGQPAPAFLRSDRWQAAGEMDEAGPMPLGFDREAARIGVRLNGFYLFTAFSPIPGLRSDSADGPSWRLAQDGSAQSAQMAN
ncbi:hypothetical protein [Microvirga makkahensis]|uniref:hypothetical protein n=1 Tax=Microvirga makkahensis TaxID=1128670 RepID=UPI0031B58B91